MNGAPLAGIRVLELAAYISGPYATSLLAALGADVVKIEPPEGEAFRIGMDNRSPFFAQYNAGKRSVSVNLKSAEGIALVKELLPHFDVVVENMRPGKLASLGLGEDVCRAINPRLVYVSISGFGSGGNMADRPAYDSIGQAIGGMYTMMNDPGDVKLTGTCMADLITGMSTALGITVSLLGRERREGRGGVYLETSVMEAVSTLTIDALTQALDGDFDPVRQTRHPQAQNFCLKTASGDYIVMHLSSSQKFWRGLVRAAGREDLTNDPRYDTYVKRVVPETYHDIVALLAVEFIKLPRDEWERRLTEADVPFAPALTVRQVASHPQIAWHKLLTKDDNGKGLVRPPWRFDGERPARGDHVPRIGEHTREVLAEFLGQRSSRP
jgi:formyl-CoA transferase